MFNLTFHGLGRPHRTAPAGEARLWLEPGRFESILDTVAGRSDVRLSFDDGNASDVEIALPALVARGMSATFFVVAERLGKPGFLTDSDAQLLVASGMEVGSHGLRHRPWRQLAPAALNDELVVSRTLLAEAAGREVTKAACPFGAYDRRVLRAARRAGYDTLFTSDSGPARPSAWLQPRQSLRTHEDGRTVQATLRAWRGPGRRVARTAKLALKRWR